MAGAVAGEAIGVSADAVAGEVIGVAAGDVARPAAWDVAGAVARDVIGTTVGVVAGRGAAGGGGGSPAPASGSGTPTDLRLTSLGRPVAIGVGDDPGEPADQGGDPELDIDQDLDRAADQARPDERARALQLSGLEGLELPGVEPSRALELPGLELPGVEPSRALELPGLEGLELPGVEPSRALELPGLELAGPGGDDLRAGYATDRDADLSGPFDAVAGSDGTGAFAGLFADVALDDADETGAVPAAETAAEGWAERAGLRYGDRVAGWIRPQYQDEPAAAAGEYWTPVPMGSYETEYGWPTPVERLPEVPPYPPATGFDVPVEVESEPTKPVPQWPPARPDGRIELPRSWSQRGETGPAFRTAVERRRPAADGPAERTEPVDGPSRTGRFGGEETHRDGRQTVGEGAATRSDRPAAGHGERPADPPGNARSDAVLPGGVRGVRDAERVPPNRVGGNRVPARRGPGTGRGDVHAAREESLEGPIWTVPDLPEAAMPDLTWSPEEAEGHPLRRPAVMIRRRRVPGPAAVPPPVDEATRALSPVELAQPDQRARPRPRPRPGNGQQEPRSTVYVSRHAAEPS